MTTTDNNTNTDTPSTNRTIGPVTITAMTAAALTTVACWILSANSIDVPTEVQGAFTTIFVGLAGWVVPSKRGKRSL